MNNRVPMMGLLLATSVAWAQAELPPPPVITPTEATGGAVEADETLTPEVNIIQTEQAVIEEYRRNGQLYLVKVTPRGGPPYYFLDRDGDGTLETVGWWRAETPVPMWRLFSW